ncbi:class II glutamine amidotransferase [Psychrobacter alimentarius]|uniref:class II glutamine amidotransferase n=1 Tax=Psychrobacter alimentarius TaxID=261164 RepID=UPI00191AC5C9|nr:class II glutamine amidotransferase [Psychrobacter alimentarius]
MCQLLAMNSKNPADIGFSFAGFRARGGLTDDHIDGFGIAYFEPTGVRLYCDNRAAMDSPLAELVSQTRVKAANTIVHIRKSDDQLLCNAHPFTREIWGEAWVFSHNGKMTIRDASDSDPINQATGKQGKFNHYIPVGDTDSEFAFCYLLNQLKDRFEHKPDAQTLYEFLTEQCRFLANYGLFNCLLSNGEWMLGYATTLLFYVTRQAHFGSAALIDVDVTMDFETVNEASDVITVFATTPLTSDEEWQQLAVNECIIFANGNKVYQDVPQSPIYLSIAEGLAIAKNA